MSVCVCMCMEREEGTWGREGERISFLVRLLTNRHKHLILILRRMWVGYEAGYNVHVPNHTCVIAVPMPRPTGWVEMGVFDRAKKRHWDVIWDMRLLELRTRSPGAVGWNKAAHWHHGQKGNCLYRVRGQSLHVCQKGHVGLLLCSMFC